MSSSPTPSAGPGIGTLIVDDHADVRLMLRMVIESHGDGLFVTGEAESGHEALERIDELDPAVILLDTVMPGLDGLGTARLIREKRPAQPIVLCSADVDDDLLLKAEAAGIDDCVSKYAIADLPGALKRAGARAGA